MTTKKSFLEQHKDTIQVVYGTVIACGIYFGLSNKIDLIAQRQADDKVMFEYRLNKLETKETQHTDKKYDCNKYAVLPKETDLNDE